MPLVHLTEGDTAPVTFKQFRDVDGAAIITNMVAAVQFSLKHQAGGAVAVSLAACVITSAAAEPLQCQWSPGAADLNSPGLYEAELVITYANGAIKRFPSAAGDFTVVVRPKTV